ncbi:helix-turn-helix domain-containing protein [Nannocystis pusilla]|uniref:Helix-turn-helix domain-containing protein n=1 Tax=Nannocystis pusilla TaxID=889268 RepID=A0ABS7TMD8_9BACT|nr:helix-turn-helix domain-containing protein [Nannocystis pusilla]
MKTGYDRAGSLLTAPAKGGAKQAGGSSSALLRAAEVAELIGSTEAQVRNMRARGQLPPPIKVPGLGVRWRRTDLEKWLAQLGERHGAVG